MAQAADIGTKRLISLAPDAWVRWIMGRDDATAEAPLAEEFKWVSRRTDALLRVSTSDSGPFLLLTEIQSSHDPHMPRRMQAYAALAEEHYRLPVYPVVINITPPAAGATIPQRYEQTFLGLQARRDYRVINLWEIDAEAALLPPVLPLLPFVPMLRGGSTAHMIRQALATLHAHAQAREFEPILAYFASLALGAELASRIVRLDMVVIEQSPWYQELVARDRHRQITRLLEHRFGQTPPHIDDALRQRTAEELESLLLAAADAPSLDAFAARLNA